MRKKKRSQNSNGGAGESPKRSKIRKKLRWDSPEELSDQIGEESGGGAVGFFQLESDAAWAASDCFSAAPGSVHMSPDVF